MRHARRSESTINIRSSRCKHEKETQKVFIRHIGQPWTQATGVGCANAPSALFDPPILARFRRSYAENPRRDRVLAQLARGRPPEAAHRFVSVRTSSPY
eukprot:5888774-Pyramimonas_sp.AAC.1